MTSIFLIIQAFIIGAFLVYVTIPVVVKVSKAKNLFDVPDERKVNKTVIPNLGGIAIFIGVSIASFLSLYELSFPDLRYIMTGVIIMFFIGIKDDILLISPKFKFFAQLVAAMLVVIPGDIRFTNLHGVMGLYHIDYVLSLAVSLLAVLAIINAVNLIDGIDGLAAAIGMLASFAFGLLFMEMRNAQYAIVSFALLGSLLSFFVFNVFGRKNKIFMGDTGSLIVGLLLAVLVIKFNEFAVFEEPRYNNIAPTLSLALMALPVYDMLRVFLLRIMRKKSPFAPDMNHVHHKLLKIGCSHLKSTLILIACNLIFIGSVLLTIDMNVNYQILTLSLIVTLFSFIPNAFIAVKTEKARDELDIKENGVKSELLKKIFTL